MHVMMTQWSGMSFAYCMMIHPLHDDIEQLTEIVDLPLDHSNQHEESLLGRQRLDPHGHGVQIAPVSRVLDGRGGVLGQEAQGREGLQVKLLGRELTLNISLELGHTQSVSSLPRSLT